MRQEIDWFSETFRMPSNLKIIPEKEPLQTFESIIHNNPYDRVLPEFDMTQKNFRNSAWNVFYQGTTCDILLKLQTSKNPIFYMHM